MVFHCILPPNCCSDQATVVGSTAKQYLGHWQGLRRPETNPGVATSHLPLQCLEKLSARELLIASEVSFFLGIVREVALAPLRSWEV